MPCNRATARNDREKTGQYVGELVQKTVICSILCRKTSSENCYFQHCMLSNQCDQFHYCKLETHLILKTRCIMVKIDFTTFLKAREPVDYDNTF